MCIYIYICIHICIPIYIYIYIHTYRKKIATSQRTPESVSEAGHRLVRSVIILQFTQNYCLQKEQYKKRTYDKINRHNI